MRSDERMFEPSLADDHSNGEDGDRARMGDTTESLFYRRACILAYAAVKSSSVLLTQKRTYLQTKLKEQLQIGKKYTISYFKLSDNKLKATF